jgi:hypothetical protein
MQDYNEIIEDLKFERLLSESQHKALMQTLKGLTSILERVEKANTENARTIAAFVEKLNQISAPNVTVQAPNVSVSNDSVSAEIAKLTQELMAKLCAPAATPAPKEFTFEIIRNQAGVISSVKAKQK